MHSRCIYLYMQYTCTVHRIKIHLLCLQNCDFHAKNKKYSIAYQLSNFCKKSYKKKRSSEYIILLKGWRDFTGEKVLCVGEREREISEYDIFYEVVNIMGNKTLTSAEFFEVFLNCPPWSQDVWKNIVVNHDLQCENFLLVCPSTVPEIGKCVFYANRSITLNEENFLLYSS